MIAAGVLTIAAACANEPASEPASPGMTQVDPSLEVFYQAFESLMKMPPARQEQYLAYAQTLPNLSVLLNRVTQAASGCDFGDLECIATGPTQFDPLAITDAVAPEGLPAGMALEQFMQASVEAMTFLDLATADSLPAATYATGGGEPRPNRPEPYTGIGCVLGIVILVVGCLVAAAGFLNIESNPKYNKGFLAWVSRQSRATREQIATWLTAIKNVKKIGPCLDQNFQC